MKIILQLFLIILCTSSFFAQGKENPYPKFIPYADEQNTSDNKLSNLDIKDLGKEQPARWLSVDPLADKYPSWSPYNYCLNNPLLFIDPNGDSVEVAYTSIPMVEALGYEPMYHTLLILTDEETGEVTTLEGMPEFRTLGIIGDIIQGQPNSSAWGNLVSDPTTVVQEISLENRETVSAPEAMSDAEFRNALISVASNYDNNVQYAPFPEFKTNTANSNSYTFSILNAVARFHVLTKNSPGWFINIFGAKK